MCTVPARLSAENDDVATGVEFEFRLSRQRVGAVGAQGPFRLLVMGDFSGAQRAPRSSLAARRTLRVDLDSFDSVLARLAPAVTLPPGLAAPADQSLVFATLDDFSPDAIASRLDVIKGLRESRRRLLASDSFEAEAESLRMGTRASAVAADDPVTVADEADADTLTRLLGDRRTSPCATVSGNQIAARFIADAVAPFIVPDADPRQGIYVRWVEQAMAERLREVVRHPRLRELERAWRSLHQLVQALDPDDELEIALLDIKREELVADLAAAGDDVHASGLYERLCGQDEAVPDVCPWSVLVCDLAFGADADDLQLLAGLGRLAAEAGAPLLGGATATLAGAYDGFVATDARDWRLSPAAAASWSALRQSDAAAWLGLAAPRVMLRLPYGKGAEEVELCPFEELRDASDHEGYLWGNPAFALARLLGEAFREKGWSMEPGASLELEDMPAHAYTNADGDLALKPCAECLLNERSLHALLDAGIMPMASYRDRNAVRLLRLQSVAKPAAGLRGPWCTD